MIAYILMGWAVIFAIKPLWKSLSTPGFMFLLLGGICYTIGAILYALGKKKKYYHTVFHIFVDLGSLLHFLCILLYIM